MIQADIYTDQGEKRKIVIDGHAGFDDDGRDIVCAAVSVLALNTANSVEKFTEDRFRASEDDGYFVLEFTDKISEKSKLLLDSLVLGLTSIRDSYGEEYINVNFREV